VFNINIIVLIQTVLFYRNCISTYNLGLTSNLPYNEWLDLWEMYLDHLRKFKGSYHMKNVNIANLVNETTLNALETAHNQNALKTVQYYIYWVSFVNLS